METFQEAAKSAATELIAGSKGLETAQLLTKAFAAQFGVHANLSAVATLYASSQNPVDKNATLSTTLSTTVDAVDTVLSQLGIMEQYISLTIPKMEDGNNFGVTVQLAALKHINDTQEKLSKQLEELLKYSAARAEVVGKATKAGLAESESKTVVTTESESKGSSTGPNKDTKQVETTPNADTKTSTETKVTKSCVVSNGSAEQAFLTQSIVELDVLYYSKAKATMQATMTGYLASLDFLVKNKDKLAAPKGTSGSTAYHSMY